MSKTAETVTACPECDKAHIRERSTKTPTYLCRACGSEFNIPRERDRRVRGETDPDTMFGAGAYAELKLSLWRTLDAGTRYPRARLIAEYTDKLDSYQISTMLKQWGVDDGLVSIWSNKSNYIRFCIEIDGGVDDA